MDDFFDFQTLIDTGMAWRLEGSIGRQCMEAIESGLAVLGPTSQTDYYGNKVPGRHDVVEGSLGSVTGAFERLENLDPEITRGAAARIAALECPDCLNPYGDTEEGCDTCSGSKVSLDKVTS